MMLRTNLLILLGGCIFISYTCLADTGAYSQQQLKKKWSLTTKGDLTTPSLSPDGETIYVASDAPEMSVFALGANSGTKLWAFNASDGLDFLGPCCNSHKHGISRPIVSPDGAELYFRAGVGFFGVSTNDGSLKFAWNLFDRMTGDPTISPDSRTLYVGSYSDKLICALNLTINTSRIHKVYWDWNECNWVKRGAWSSTAVAVSPDGKSIYYGSEGGNVTALASHDGRRKWGYYVYIQSVGQPVPSPDGKAIFFMEGGGLSFYALNAEDGSKKWQYEYLYAASAPALSLDGDTVYAGFQGGGAKVRTKDGTYQFANSTLVSLDARSGRQKWVFNTTDDWEFVGTPVTDGKAVYFGIYKEGLSDRYGVFYSVNATDGSEIFAVKMLLYPTEPVAAVAPGGSLVFVLSCDENHSQSTLSALLVASEATPTYNGIVV